MRTKALVLASVVVIGLTLSPSLAASPPASTNASCVGQSVSFFIPTQIVPPPYGALVSASVQTAVPNAGQEFVKPEATTPHDECVLGG
jgi:hypothetical protein